jgi:hypothetical protein
MPAPFVGTYSSTPSGSAEAFRPQSFSPVGGGATPPSPPSEGNSLDNVFAGQPLRPSARSAFSSPSEAGSGGSRSASAQGLPVVQPQVRQLARSEDASQQAYSVLFPATGPVADNAQADSLWNFPWFKGGITSAGTRIAALISLP